MANMDDFPKPRLPWEKPNSTKAPAKAKAPANPRPPIGPLSTQNDSNGPCLEKMTYEIEIEFILFCKTIAPKTRVKSTASGPQSSHPRGTSAPAAKDLGHRPKFSSQDMGLERGKHNFIPTSSVQGIQGGLNFLIGVLRDRDVDIVRGDEVFLGKPPGPPRNETRWSAKTDIVLHQQWSLTINESLKLDENETHPAGSDILPLPVTLCTPTMTMCQEDFDEIDRVLEMIVRNYQIWINPSCGLNVNVGVGKNPAQAPNVRDIGRICWALENVMAVLHFDYRGVNNPLNLRRASNLAQGKRLDGKKPDATTPKEHPLIAGDQQLKLCKTSDQVATLLCSDKAERLSVDFRNYSKSFAKGQQEAGRLVEPTIQFRQAGVTLNTEWMCHWAGICARTCWWVCNSDNKPKLDSIVNACSQVEGDPARSEQVLHYFLTEIGAQDQIKYIVRTDHQQRMRPRPS